MDVNRNGVSIVIPNYNGLELLKTYLPYTLKAAKKADVSYEIIIADDASTDSSVSFLQEEYHYIKLIENKVNKGFSANTNSGVFKAIYPWVLILNSDVKLDEYYIKHLLDSVTEPNVFGVMGQIVNHDQTIADAAKFPAYQFINIDGGKNYQLKVNDHVQKYLPSFFLSGANMLVNRKVFMNLGGFDTVFSPYYYEDADLGIRAWRAGYSSYYIPQAVCTHHAATTISKSNSATRIKVIVRRNKMILHAIHLPSSYLLIWLIITVVKSFIIKPIVLDFTYTKAFIQFAQRIKEVIKSRSSNSSSILTLPQVVKKIKQMLVLDDVTTF